MKCSVDNLENVIALTSRGFQGGIKLLAEKMSVNPGTLYNKCNPDMSSHHLTLKEAVGMMEYCNDVRILEFLCRETHHACVPQTQFCHVGDMVLFDAWTASDIEHGKTAESIHEALSDKRIDEKEYHHIRAEMFVDFARQLELLNRLNAFCNNPPADHHPAITDLKQAVFKTVQQHPAGLSQLAQKISMREIDLSKKSNPDYPDEYPSLQDTLKLMIETEDFTILYSISHLLDHTCISIPVYQGENDMALLDAWSHWSDERGDTVAVIHKALTDGAIDQQESNRIETEMFQDFETELALLARLASMIQ